MAATLDMKDMIRCSKCGRPKKKKEFYKQRNGEHYDVCKGCLTMHVHNYKPDTFTWILEIMDVPYIESIWNKLRDAAYLKNPDDVGGSPVLGKYLSQMRIARYKDYGWADTQMIKEEEEKAAATEREYIEKRNAELQEKFDKGEITQSQYETLVETTYIKENAVEMPAPPPSDLYPPIPQKTKKGGVPPQFAAPPEVNYFPEEEMIDYDAELTKEDKIYLAMKWGRMYKPAEWIQLEKTYRKYDDDFGLHNVDLERNTIQLCKLLLKGEQALDMEDYDGYAKINRAADNLRKTLKFTEAQRKGDAENKIDCTGVIWDKVELYNDEDFVQAISLDVPRDIVDEDIMDIKRHTSNLIQEDASVFRLIEEYIKKRETIQQEEEMLKQQNYALSDDDLVEVRHATEIGYDDEEDD